MSEQTPNSSEDLSGAEPSMEDILASIRKIISDDEPVAMESPEDVQSVKLVENETAGPLDDLMQGIHTNSNDLTSDAVLDAAVIQPDTSLPEGESIDLDIDDVLAGLDADVLEFDASNVPEVKAELGLAEAGSSETLEVAEEMTASDDLDIDSLMSDLVTVESDGDIPQTDDDILAFLDADIPLAAEPVVSLTQAGAETSQTEFPENIPEKIAASDDIEMDALLDDILTEPLEVEAESSVQDMPIGTGATAELETKETDSDLELVKSLMADLADDQGEVETDEDLDALLAIPEAEDETVAETAAAEMSDADTEDDILGDILNMTLEDELKSHPEDAESETLAAAQDEYLESLDAVIGDVSEDIDETMDTEDEDLPSLTEIAAAAEADAVAVEKAQAQPALAATAGVGAVAGLAALGSTKLGATIVADAPEEAETETAETQTAETLPEPTPEITPIEETPMPVKAVTTDTILDDVTEAATAGAFAELNQVVEDKAIFNERGPRIGDLVQEALRPMLKEWLDANLKGIVERAVTKEVKRISSGK